MTQHQLTPQELARMDIFGYLVFPGLLQDRIERIIEEFEATFARPGGHFGKAHDGTQRSCILPFIDQTPYLASLLDDPRLDGIFSSLLGADYNYLGSDGNFYVGSTGWHSDTDWSGKSRGKPPRLFYKLALYLDPVSAASGALRVIPGSHRYGDSFAEDLQNALHDPQASLGLVGDQVARHRFGKQPGRRGDLQPGHQAQLLGRQQPAAHVHHQLHRALHRGRDTAAAQRGGWLCTFLARFLVRRGHDAHRRPTAPGTHAARAFPAGPPGRGSAQGQGYYERAGTWLTFYS
jgi:hypothetical protein